MRKLLRGIAKFRAERREGYRETFARLAMGQSPDTLLVACSDSRVAPNVFASTEPGDLFVVRNVGNLVPAHDRATGDAAAAAVAFATDVLSVTDIIVCGHSHCGAMRALCGDLPVPAGLAPWLAHAAGAFERFRAGERCGADLAPHDHLSQINVLAQIANLQGYPAVRRGMARGRLRLHAWWFDIAQAEVLAHDEGSGRFETIDAAHADRILARLGPA